MPVATSTLILGGIALAKGAYDIHQQGVAARGAQAEADYQAEVFGRNADLAEEQAKDALARGRESELALRRKARGLMGSQRAAFAGQGIDINDGSARDVMQNDQALSELDALTIRNNAQRESLGFRQQAEFDRADAELARRGGRNRANAIRKEGIGTLLTTATSVYGSWESKGSNVGRYTASGHPRGGAL